MASITQESSGGWRLKFRLNRQPRSIRLGKTTKLLAERVKMRVEHLLSAINNGETFDAQTAKWLADCGPTLRKKLAAQGLIHDDVRGRDAAASRLGNYLERYIAERKDVKQNTRENYEQARRHLVAFFGADAPITRITAGHAAEFRRHLLNREVDPLSKNTVAGHCKNARLFFGHAEQLELISKNPFKGMACKVRPNKEKWHTITRDDAERLLAACPNNEWKLIISLSRYGGLRCPSEHFALRWEHIHFDLGRMTVPCPKTEHIEGRAYRVVPLFPELRPYLEAAYTDAQVSVGADAVPSKQFIFGSCRKGSGNLRTQLGRIIERAALTPWPDPFRNMRRNRANEVEREFGQTCERAWIGHDEATANDHYLGADEADFERAVGSNPAPNPAHEIANSTCQDVPQEEHNANSRNNVQQRATGDESLPPRGVEPRFSG